MVKISTPDGAILYDEWDDLRGNETHKNIEKAHGPDAILTMADGSKWRVNRCPLCDCHKSFDPDVGNVVKHGCDGECPCHALPHES